MVKTGTIRIPHFQHISPRKGSGEVIFIAELCNIICTVHIITVIEQEADIVEHLNKHLGMEEE
uniref:Uncharacterized protein n=1 Tax=viral metagenome TaxID=1070528 RepID=A0A6H1ZGY4_9ZZZZ